MLPLQREKGQGLIEYALLLLLIVIVVIAILYLFGLNVRNVFSNIVNSISPGATSVTYPAAPSATDIATPCSSNRSPLGGPPVDVKVQFTLPSHCATGLARVMRVGSIYTGELSGKEIWVLVYPADSKYYPQTLDPCKQVPSEASRGIWNTIVHFGGPPQQYDLVGVVAEADGEASRNFKAWLARGCKTKQFPGYARNELPTGITEVTAITVSTEPKSPTEPPGQVPTPPATDACPLDDIRFRTPIGGRPVNATVKFQFPYHCATSLDKGITAGGTYKGDLTSQEIWILVYPSNSKYYPQTVDSCKQIPTEASAGVWRTKVYFGGPPQQYDLIAAVAKANSRASQKFKEWLKRGCDTGDFPGYLKDELPDGLTEVAAITVSTVQ